MNGWNCTAAAVAMFVMPGIAASPGAKAAQVAQAAQQRGYVLADQSGAVPILVDEADAPLVGIAATMLGDDVFAVTGQRPRILHDRAGAEALVVAGAIGHSAPLDDLIARGKVDVSGVAGVWEAYRVVTVRDPWPGVKHALVVLGADRRGAAYGLLSLSRQLGISPWQWWSDVPPPKREEARVVPEGTVVAPSVRYRGIFINDEDWSLRPWSETTLEPERGNIGPATYARVFALLLRLRANLLWPAMHPGTLAFNQDPRNAELAERYGIVMGSSHAEPMLRDNVAEWDAGQMGDFDFSTNPVGVTRYWEERVKANARFENIFTVGIRGVHDSPAETGKNIDRVKLLEQVIYTQRGLLAHYVRKDVDKVPQVFLPYKEVLDVYRKGMQLPPDITLGWVDDNFGYIRQLSTPEEQARSGGGGVYYHVSYWGWPTSYLWLATTPPALIASEMGRAWDTNARTMWVVNVGDIKPGEIDAEYFLDLAWNYDKVSTQSQLGYLTEWAGRTFGSSLGPDIAGILNEQYRLGFIRKPEHMDFAHDDVGVQPSGFSPVAYGDEAGQRLAEYAALLARATALEARVPAVLRDAYYQLVLYPVTGARWMAEKALMADRSYLAAWQGRASADLYARRSQAALANIHAATARYNAIGNGKWRNFMNDDPRDQAVFAGFPTGSAVPNTQPGLGVAVEGAVDALARSPARARADYAEQVGRWRTEGIRADALPPFDAATKAPHFLDLFNTGTGSLSYRVTANVPWVTISAASGTLDADRRLWVTVDWARVPAQASGAVLTVTAGNEVQTIVLRLADRGARQATPGTIVAVDGTVAIEAEKFDRSSAVAGDAWTVRDGLGRIGAAIETKASVRSRTSIRDAPFVEYDFDTDLEGAARLTVAALPTFPLDRNRQLRYAVSIDGAPAQTVDMDAGRDWAKDVVRNARFTTTRWQIQHARHHRIRLYALDPALAVDRLVLDFGGAKTSYLGPPETRVRQ